MRELPKRKPNRLQGYDYRLDGAYFVTICCKDRAEIFGKIIVRHDPDVTIVMERDGQAHPLRPAGVALTEYGVIAENEMNLIAQHYSNVTIDCYVIMPNHVHAIIIINYGEAERASPSPTVGNIVGGYKSGVSRLCGFQPWQRSFHDRIIRDEEEYNSIAEYIVNNPAKWEQDCFYPLNVGQSEIVGDGLARPQPDRLSPIKKAGGEQ